MQENKILKAYEKMIDDNNNKIKKNKEEKVNEGKIKDFFGKMKDEFLVNIWVTGVFKAADVFAGGKTGWRDTIDKEETINKMKKQMEKAGMKDPLLGKIIKRMEQKWK